MAIPQNRYIDIDSGVANATVGERALQGLAFTLDDMVAGAPADVKAKFVQGLPIKMTLSDVSACFGASSRTLAFAKKYFSYIGPSGNTPTSITIAKYLYTISDPSSYATNTAYTVGTYVDKSDDTYVCTTALSAAANTAWDAVSDHFAKVSLYASPTEAFEAVDGMTNDFGSITFIDEWTNTESDATNPFGASSLLGVAAANSAKNYKYLFVIGFTPNDTRKTALVNGASGYSGTHLVQGADSEAAAMPMAMTASIDYDRSDSTICLMFKQFPGEEPTVETTADADALDAKFVNYVGKTQTNGMQLSFYQRGFNSDGLDTSVYYNEMWLKSRIATAFFNAVTSTNKIPANNDGADLVKSIVLDSVNYAFRNGTITIKTSLTPVQRATIVQLAGGDTNAQDEVLTNGYWLDVVIQPIGSSTSEYKAVYTLIYSKGDAIRFVQGYHELI